MNPTTLAILAIAFLIFVHELGHWLAARLLGLQTPIFSIGFGGGSLSLKLGKIWQTELRLGMIPLGGFVIVPELMDAETRDLASADLGIEAGSFVDQPVWKKAIVMLKSGDRIEFFEGV